MHFLWIIGGIAAGIVLLLLGSWVVQSLWNWLSPTLKTPAIEFKHAVAILLLSRILFGGIGGGGHFGGPHPGYASQFSPGGQQPECARHWDHKQHPEAAPLPGVKSDSTGARQ